MYRYRVIKAIQLHDGVLELNVEQSLLRERFLQRVSGGFKIISPVWFKRGEEFSIDSEIIGHEKAGDVERVGFVAESNIEQLTTPINIDYPIQLKAGWFELSDGRKVRGQEEALDEQTLLDEIKNANS